MRMGYFCLFLALILASSCSDSEDNVPPYVSAFIVPEMVKCGDAVTFQVFARDPDGDRLNYVWEVDGTRLNSKTPTVRWTVPDTAGTISVRVQISDGVNDAVAQQKSLIVTNSLFPTGPIDRCAYLGCDGIISDDVPWPFPSVPDYEREVQWRNAGLRVIDVSDPGTPREAGFCRTWYRTSDLSVVGDYAYLSCHSRTLEGCGDHKYYGGLSVVDISDPRNPQEICFVKTESASGLLVADGYAYTVTWYGGLFVFDVSVPANAHEVGLCRIKSLDFMSSSAVSIRGDHIYLKGVDAILVVDASDRREPRLVASYELDGIKNVYVSGSYAYAFDSGDRLRVIGVSDLGNIQEVGSCVVSSICGLYIYGSYVYARTTDGGIRVIDAADLENPYEAGGCHIPGVPHDIAIAGDYAYVSGENTDVQKDGCFCQP